MSDTKYYTPPGSNIRVPYTAPHEVDGLLTEQPKAQRYVRSREGTIRPILKTEVISSLSAGHGGTFRERVARFVPSEREALRKRMAQMVDRRNDLMFQGESNRVLPDRGSFSADKKSKKREIRSSYSRGDVVVHMAGHKRLTIVGTSKSKPGFLKAVDSAGNEYRVHPTNIKPL